MKLLRAENILRKYIRGGIEYSPEITSDWKIYKKENSIFIKSEILNKDLYFLSMEKYLDKYIFSENSIIKNDKVEGMNYLTSEGLVSEEEYYQAIDTIEIYGKGIKEKDLVKGEIYLSNKDKEYIYIGKLQMEISKVKYNDRDEPVSLKKELIQTTSYLYDLAKDKLIKKRSIKLVEISDDKHISGHILIGNKINVNVFEFIKAMEIYTESKKLNINYVRIHSEEYGDYNERKINLYNNLIIKTNEIDFKNKEKNIPEIEKFLKSEDIEYIFKENELRNIELDRSEEPYSILLSRVPKPLGWG